METQTWLSRHNKFILAENITILSVLSDYYLHASLSSQCSKCGVTVRIQKIKKRNKKIKTNNSHTLSTLIDLYDFHHIFYVKNNPHLLSLDTDWIFKKYIYIYIVIHRQTVLLYHNTSVWLDT